jgi:hypothetical protein
MMRRLVVAIALLGALAALLAGCSAKGTLKPNTPPETTIFVQGPVDTVNHNVHLYWFGTDPDGEITGYEIRFLNPSAPADTCWTFVPPDSTDRVFSVYTPAGFAAPVFEVRAIDNSGEAPPVRSSACELASADTVPHPGTRDPSPAREDFKFRNLPPTLSLLNRFRLADTTFASATVQWSSSDPDGDGTKLRFRIWLDGNESIPDVVAGNSFTVPTARFLQGGLLLSGYRQLFIQAVDDGGMLSRVDSIRWYVRAPATGGHYPHLGRLLIVDDVPRAFSQNFSTDTIYYNTAARNLAPGEYSILQMDFTQPFRSAKDIEQTFNLFDAVVWYIGGSSDFRTYETTLASYQAGLAAYLDAGGKVYMDGQDLVDGPHARGPLGNAFVTDHLGSDFLFQYYSTVVQDSTVGWSNTNPSYFVSRWGDSLRVQQLTTASGFSLGGFRAFGVRDDQYTLVSTAMPPLGSLLPVGILPLPVPVAVTVPQPNDGLFMVVTFPLRAASTPPPTNPRYFTVHRFMARVFHELGLAP